MANGLNFTEQFTLVNAPAGSGKTTAVSKSIKKLLLTPHKKILCITYTNRAAEQLNEKVDNDSVEIGTIHSFIGNFMRPFFKLKPIVDYFLEYYEENIFTILESKDEKEVVKLKRYREKNNIKEDCTVTKQTIANNINYLEYGETQFTSFLYGRLSHDDLLKFSKAVLEKFPKLNKAISQRYSYIFIDEYQDAHSEILELFYNACINRDTKLVLLGDEMQQIYKDRVEGFQEVINSRFVREYSLKKNWRSQENIVNLLNNIYYDSTYKQHPQIAAEKKPKIHIVEELNNIKINQNTLQLVLYNSDLFKAIGAYNLYVAYNERYKNYDKYNSKEILLSLTMDNPDDLMVLLIFITEISDLFDNQQFGQLIQKIMNFRFANKEIWKIKNHLDKRKVAQYLNELSKEIKKDITIEVLLSSLRENEIIDTSHIDTVIGHIEIDVEFKNKINSVKFREFINCYNEMKNPKFSTQHAVKGEGYDYVALMVSDSMREPNVKMYFFLELFSKGLFNYEELTFMNNEIRDHIKSFSNSIGKKVSGLKAADYNEYEQQCNSCMINIKRSLLLNKQLFEEFFVNEFSLFEEKANITNFKKCIRTVNRIDGALLAYKLFYVGCSRAKKQLDVYVIYNSIHGFKKEFISKMKNIDFEVEFVFKDN
ncbi:UvrD-helicase domain-containing protein [Bacillus weihaiensis]|uniref:UvrD-helicase domain-containing protein n=1 Tax=Bacillus weihaiensis TaxID=1547283 RepID=UPI002352D469|nr:UvrD-helicase domain-containing protein [Bacillus weihaiensis]